MFSADHAVRLPGHSLPLGTLSGVASNHSPKWPSQQTALRRLMHYSAMDVVPQAVSEQLSSTGGAVAG